MTPPFRKVPVSLIAMTLGLAILPAHAEDPVLVRHKDAVVTKADFDAYMQRVPAALQREARADGPRNETVVDLLFTNRVLAQEARAAGLDKDPVMARRIEQHVEAFLAQQFTSHLENTAPLPANLEARARELYLANPAQHTEPPRMGLHHILVDLYGRTREMALERAREVRAKALAGEDFLALAARYSNDPGLKANNGALGFPAQSELDPEVGQAAFALKANGEISDVVESRFGFHVLKRIGFLPGHRRKFEDVKDALIEQEKAKLRNDVSMKHIDAIRRSPDTRWDRPAVASLRTIIPQEELDRAAELARKREAEFKARAAGGGAGAAPAPGRN